MKWGRDSGEVRKVSGNRFFIETFWVADFADISRAVDKNPTELASGNNSFYHLPAAPPAGGPGSLWKFSDGSVTQVETDTNWAKVSSPVEEEQSFLLAIKDIGSLWSWGKYILGLLGLGLTTTQLSPQQVGALSNWSFLEGRNSHYCALKSDGTIWCWGAGGDGSFWSWGGVTSSPVQTGTDSVWGGLSEGINWLSCLRNR